MAKIAYQEPYENFNGRDSSRRGPDGQVCYHVQGRPIARRFIRARNPQTPPQQLIRAIFRGAGAAWNALSEDAKNSWESPQAGVTRTDAAGHQYTVIGRSLFVESYMYNTLTANTTPEFGPNGSVWPYIVSVNDIHPDSTSDNMELSFTPGSDYGNAYAYVTPPLSPGTRRIPDRAFRVAAKGPFGLISLDTFPDKIVIPVDKLNLPITPGSRIGVRLKVLSENYLLSGPTTDAILTVGAPG